MTATAIADVLGIPTDRPVDSNANLIEFTRRGLPSSVVSSLAADLAIPRARVAKALSISDRTLSRRITSKSRLTAEESDRVVRFARVLASARNTLGTIEKASRWLQTPNRALNGQSPFDLLDTDAGVQSVETVLGRIAYGVYS